MKKFIIVILALLTLIEACAPSTDKLTFRPDGTFRILQFTDLHLQLFHPDQVADVFTRMDSLVRQADPDLIAVTGDLLYSSPADSLMQLIVGRLDSYARPWAIVYGNHDHEHGLTLAQLSPIITSGRHTINTLAPSGVLADMEIPVFKTPGRAGGDRTRHARPFIKYRHARHDRASFYLFFLDSHAYSTDPIDYSNFSYAWFEPEQVEWVRHTAGQHPNTPSIAFFHIPFPEYAEVTNYVGEWTEPVCCPKYNSGMFGAMKETGFIATFCGHDHDNSYAGIYDNVLLAYGRYSGSNGEYNHLPKGARLITLRYDGSLQTCILDASGSHDLVSFPE